MRGRLLLILGIILALISGLLVFKLLTAKPAKVEEKPKTRKVLIALQNLPAGTKIPPEAVGVVERPEDEVPADAFTTPTQVRGKFAAVDIFQGDIILPSMVKTQAEIIREKPSSLVPPGKVAFTIRVDELSSVAYAIQPGDYVDVIVGLWLVDVDQDLQYEKTGPEGEPQIPRYVVQLTLQNVEVLNVGLQAQPPVQEGEETGGRPTGRTSPAPEEGGEVPEQGAVVQYDYITLLLPQQDAEVIEYLRRAGAVITLALRNPEDHNVVTTEPVTLEYIIRRFRYVEPSKQPYTIKAKETGEEMLR